MNVEHDKRTCETCRLMRTGTRSTPNKENQ